MKRIIIGMLIFSDLLAGVYYSLLCANHEPQITGIVFEDVEALTQGEYAGSTVCLFELQQDKFTKAAWHIIPQNIC
jgi:hypothetical protein